MIAIITSTVVTIHTGDPWYLVGSMPVLLLTAGLVAAIVVVEQLRRLTRRLGMLD